MVAETHRETITAMYSDLSHLVATHQDALLAEADMDRLAAMLPAQLGLRHRLAHGCLRLATWLDTEYVRASDSGPADWATHSASV